MATTQKPLAFGTLTTTSLTEIFPNSSSSQIHPFLVLTNDSGTIVEATVIISNAGVDRILAVKKIPAGSGKNWRVLEMSDTRIGPNYAVKLQIDTVGPVNFFLSGIEQDS